MHLGRTLAIVGVIIGVIGLFMGALTTSGEELLPTLNAANPAFPDGIPTIWGGLATWAQVVLVILILVVLALAVRGARKDAIDRNSSMEIAAIGVALAAYAVIKLFEARDEADTLQGAFGQAAGGGLIPEAYTVSTGSGFYVLILGTVLVIGAGLLGLTRSE